MNFDPQCCDFFFFNFKFQDHREVGKSLDHHVGDELPPHMTYPDSFGHSQHLACDKTPLLYSFYFYFPTKVLHGLVNNLSAGLPLLGGPSTGVPLCHLLH